MLQQCPPVGPVTKKSKKNPKTDQSVPVKKEKKLKPPVSVFSGVEGGDPAVSGTSPSSSGKVRSPSPASCKYESELIEDFKKWEEETTKLQQNGIKNYLQGSSVKNFGSVKSQKIKSDNRNPQQWINEKIDAVFFERFNLHFSSILGIFWVLAFFLIFVSYLSISPLHIFLLALFTTTVGFCFAERVVNCFSILKKNFHFALNEFRVTLPGIPKILKTEAEINTERENFAAQVEFFQQEKKIVEYRSKIKAKTPTNFNYKVRVRVNDDRDVIAEIDTDSHISLISESYYRRLCKFGFVEELDEEPISFCGMGSEIQSKYPPIILKLQIGRVLLESRFVITDLLKSSPILLGSDFCIKNRLWVAPYSEDSWFVTVGPLDKPIAKVPALITNKLTLCSKAEFVFSPGEIKKIEVIFKGTQYAKEIYSEHGSHPTLKKSDFLDASPFDLVSSEVQDKNFIVLQNQSVLPSILPDNVPLAESFLDLTSFQINQSDEGKFRNPSHVETSEDFPNLNFNEMDILEAKLEPGFSGKNIIDKKAELDFVKNHKLIPEEFKDELVSFLNARASLFSGEEFSREHFPRELYEHNVELVQLVHSLSSRPFPVSGIRLQQLKADIDDLVSKTAGS
jgi:hypothetical protein